MRRSNPWKNGDSDPNEERSPYMANGGITGFDVLRAEASGGLAAASWQLQSGRAIEAVLFSLDRAIAALKRMAEYDAAAV